MVEQHAPIQQHRQRVTHTASALPAAAVPVAAVLQQYHRVCASLTD
jgi:hypothetical protein